MSKISDIYENIKQQQYLLVKTKLQEAIRANLDGRTLSEQEQRDYGFSFDEAGILAELLKENGLSHYEDFEDADYDYPAVERVIIKSNNKYIMVFVSEWGSEPSILPLIIPSEELEEFLTTEGIDKGFKALEKEEIEEEIKKINVLQNIDIDKIETKPIIEVNNPTMEDIEDDEYSTLDDYLYSINGHYVIDNRDNREDADGISTAYLSEIIYDILRGQIIDTKANAMFGEPINTCPIGQYSDMPGEEEIAKVLNSVDRKLLAQYFKDNPDDLELFEEMRKKYGNIQSLDGIEIERSPRQRFEESLLRDDVVEYYLSKTPEELEKEFGTEVARMVGFAQNNSHHCYDLWEHTLRTVEGIKQEGLTDEQSKKLRVAAFFHDIGKPDVATFNPKTGQQVFYGHAQHSVDVAKNVLERLGYSQEEIEQLGFYIGHHDDFISYKTTLQPFMQNHEFIREINAVTVAEKVIENKYNFEAMGYNKDEIRAIVYTLAHGKQPDFRTKDGPISIPVDMDEVKSKMSSREFSASYEPSLEDYQLLLQLCKADAGAQSEIAERTLPNGKKVVDGSKKEKLDNMNGIESDMPMAYKGAMSVIEAIEHSSKKEKSQDTGYTFEDYITETKDGFKRPIMVMGDGISMSVQASAFHYCEPRRSGLDKYTSYEIGSLSEIIDELKEYAEAGTEDYLTASYPYVPAEVISQVVREHGGVDKDSTLHPKRKLDGYKEEKDGMQKKNQEAAALINQLMAQIGNALEDMNKGE